MKTSQMGAVLRVELWHGLLVLSLLCLLVPANVLEPLALLLGALFMGVNFLLLSYGVYLALSPFAAKGRIRTGIFLLLVKFVLLLGLVSVLFSRVRLDVPSFAVGVTCLLIALVVEGLWAYRRASD